MSGHHRPRCGLCFRVVGHSWELLEGRCQVCRDRDRLGSEVADLLRGLADVMTLEATDPVRQEWLARKSRLLAEIEALDVGRPRAVDLEDGGEPQAWD